MAGQDLTLEELRKITKVLMLAHGGAIQKQIEKVATSDERKKIWVLIDGVKMPKDLGREVGVSARSVEIFLKIASAAGLVENPRRKPPRRIIDYVPPEWIELPTVEEEVVPEESGKRVKNRQEKGATSREETKKNG